MHQNIEVYKLPKRSLFPADLLSLHPVLQKKIHQAQTFLTKDQVEKKTEMVFFGQIHPETVQSKTCKGLFLANFARPPRQTFLSKELVKKKHARAHFWPILLASWGNLFVKGFFHNFFGQSISSLPFCQRLQPFCQRLPGSFFSKTSLAISVRLMVFQKFFHSSRQIWIGIILCSWALWGANPIANCPISSAFSDYLI